MRKSHNYWIKLSLAGVFALFAVSAVAEHFVTLAHERRDTEALRQMLAQMGPAFSKVSAHTTSHPHSALFGTVERQEDRDRLEAEVTKRFGAYRAHFIIATVRVNPEVTPPTRLSDPR